MAVPGRAKEIYDYTCSDDWVVWSEGYPSIQGGSLPIGGNWELVATNLHDRRSIVLDRQKRGQEEPFLLSGGRFAVFHDRVAWVDRRDGSPKAQLVCFLENLQTGSKRALFREDAPVGAPGLTGLSLYGDELLFTRCSAGDVSTIYLRDLKTGQEQKVAGPGLLLNARRWGDRVTWTVRKERAPYTPYASNVALYSLKTKETKYLTDLPWPYSPDVPNQFAQDDSIGPAGVGVDIYNQGEAFLYDFQTGGEVPIYPASGRQNEKGYVLAGVMVGRRVVAWTEQWGPSAPRQEPKITTWMAFLER